MSSQECGEIFAERGGADVQVSVAGMLRPRSLGVTEPERAQMSRHQFLDAMRRATGIESRNQSSQRLKMNRGRFAKVLFVAVCFVAGSVSMDPVEISSPFLCGRPGTNGVEHWDR